MKPKRSVLAAVAALWLTVSSAFAAPPLPRPSGSVVHVSTEPDLQAAVRHLKSNTTIVIAPGTYVLTESLQIAGPMANVAIRGATNNADDVVLAGPGMTNPNDHNAPYGIWTTNVTDLLIANLAIRDFFYHSICFNAGTRRPHVYNVHLVDAGEQFIKSNPSPGGRGNDDGIVEYSTIEYTTTARDGYTNGIDVHTGANWTIRANVFRNIIARAGELAGPAVLVWNGSSNAVTERNAFVNCARAIYYGMENRGGPHDNTGGVIRNNVVFRAAARAGDVGISVNDSPNTKVLNNTVYQSGTYTTSIEYRFAGTTDVVIANNLVDGSVADRDGARGNTTHNYTGASAAMFVNANAGDLHLVAGTAAIDRGLTLADVVDDFDGRRRPAGAGYDIGAHEFGATHPDHSPSTRNTSSTPETDEGLRRAGLKTGATGTDDRCHRRPMRG